MVRSKIREPQVFDVDFLSEAEFLVASGVLDTSISDHATSNGTSHTYIDQDVTSTGAPTFSSIDITSNATVSGLVGMGLKEYKINQENTVTSPSIYFYRYDN